MHKIRSLLQLDANNANVRDEYGTTPLMFASLNGNFELVQHLIEQKVDVNARDLLYGWTALMQATFYGHKEVIKILLKAQADPTIKALKNGADAGFTALDISTLKDQPDLEIIHLLATQSIHWAPPHMQSLLTSRPATSNLKRSQSSPEMSLIKTWWHKLSVKFKQEPNSKLML